MSSAGRVAERRWRAEQEAQATGLLGIGEFAVQREASRLMSHQLRRVCLGAGIETSIMDSTHELKRKLQAAAPYQLVSSLAESTASMDSPTAWQEDTQYASYSAATLDHEGPSEGPSRRAQSAGKRDTPSPAAAERPRTAQSSVTFITEAPLPQPPATAAAGVNHAHRQPIQLTEPPPPEEPAGFPPRTTPAAPQSQQIGLSRIIASAERLELELARAVGETGCDGEAGVASARLSSLKAHIAGLTASKVSFATMHNQIQTAERRARHAEKRAEALKAQLRGTDAMLADANKEIKRLRQELVLEDLEDDGGDRLRAFYDAHPSEWNIKKTRSIAELLPKLLDVVFYNLNRDAETPF